MKKITFIAVCLFTGAVANNSVAQGVYFGVTGGYGFPAAKHSFLSDSKSTTGTSGTTYEDKSHPVSFGKGINAGLYAGYMLGKNVGAELGFSYLLGSKNTFTDESSNSAASASSKTEDTWKAHMIRIVPGLRMTAGEDKIHPYMHTGLIIGLGGKITNDTHTEDSDPSGSMISDESWEYTGGISLGFQAGVGINYMISDKIGIFAEACGNYQNWAMKKGSMTAYTVDGMDQMSMLDVADKEIEFVDTDTYDSSSPANPSQPSTTTKFYMPLSSIGVNIGLHIALGGKTE
jgi:hypothetical protein